MRIYFDIGELHDVLLEKKVTPRIIDKSSVFIEDLARSYGVAPMQIADPVPFKIAQLAMFYSLMTAAIESTSMATAHNSDGADAYELKRRVYKGMIDEIMGQITAETFTDGVSVTANQFPFTIKRYRS